MHDQDTLILERYAHGVPPGRTVLLLRQGWNTDRQTQYVVATYINRLLAGL